MVKRAATIKDIAKNLGLSVATVSRALRDTYDVSKETRMKVLKEAERIHYKPNLNATGLVKSNTQKIGVIIPSITNYYFSTVITGIQDYVSEQGYQVILFLTNDSLEWEKKIVGELSTSSVDGVLACVSSETTTECDHFVSLIEYGVPLVFFDRIVKSISTSSVTQDDYQGACIATEYLLQCGFRKIAHLTGPAGLNLVQTRIQGFTDTLEKHALRPAHILHSGFTQTDGYHDVLSLLDRNTEYDAIFAVNDRKAVGCILSLQQQGIQIGKEVGVMGFTDDPIAEIISPRLTTVAEPAYDIGKTACNLLINQIKKGNQQPQTIVLPTKLIVRDSVVGKDKRG